MNAGLLAIRILAAGIPSIATGMDAYVRKQTSEVIAKVQRLEETGWVQYTQ